MLVFLHQINGSLCFLKTYFSESLREDSKGKVWECQDVMGADIL